MQPAAPSFTADELLAQASWIRGLARRLVEDPVDAEDLAQDTLAAALRHRPATDRSLRPWLSTVLRRQIARVARGRQGRLAREKSVARAEALPSSVELAARAEAQQRLVGEVLALEDPYRSLLLLRFYEGLTPAEIARRHEQSPGTVRGQLSRAVAMLRERLDAHSDESRIEWRAAFVPLLREPASAALLPTLSIPPLLAMHIVPKLLLGAGLVLGAFLIHEVRTDSLHDTGKLASPQVEPSLEAPAAGGTTPELATARTTALDASQRRAAPTADTELDAGGVLRFRVEGTLSIEEPDGSLRPAEDFRLELQRAAGPSEVLRTDATGRFSGEGRFAGGELRVAMLDHADLDRNLSMAQNVLMELLDPSPVVHVEPDVPLELTLSARREFNIHLTGPASVVESIDQIELLSNSTENVDGMLSDPLRMSAPLRKGREASHEQLWVRFAPIELDTASWWLRASTEDGLHVAWAQLPESARFDPEPVELHLLPAARIEVTIPWQGAAQPNDFDVGIRPLGRVAAPLSMPAIPAEGQRTLHAFGGLSSGKYRLNASAEGTPVVWRDIELRAGFVERVTLELEYPTALYPLTLRCSSDSGEYHGTLIFWARSTTSNRIFSNDLVRWNQDENGTWTGTQNFGMVPAGEYTIEVGINRPLRAWDRTARTVVIPGPPLEIRCLDAGEKADLCLTVVDARTGAKITDPRIKIYLDGDTQGVIGLPDSAVQWPGILLTPAPRWSATAPGYREATGDWLASELVDGVQRVTVTLEPEE